MKAKPLIIISCVNLSLSIFAFLYPNPNSWLTQYGCGITGIIGLSYSIYDNLSTYKKSKQV